MYWVSNKTAHCIFCLIYIIVMYNKLNNVEIYCTMKSGKNLCNIMVKPANKIDATTGAEIESKTYKKFPKLSELHEFLFNETPKNLHDSMVDTIV